MNKILVIRYKFIGDVLMTSAICNSLKQSFPDAEIDYMVHAVSAPLFENHPYIDNVIAVTDEERSSTWKYLKKIREIAAKQYDVIIDASSIAKTEVISLLSRQAKYRIGRKKKRQGFSYTHTIAKIEERGDKIVQRIGMLAPLEKAGFKIQHDNSMLINIAPQERQHQRQQMLDHGVDFDRPIFVFSVSAKFTQKKWRLDYMQEVAQHCLDHHGAQIILYAGAPHEVRDIRSFHKAMGMHKDIYSEIKTTSIRDLAALFANCDMFIGNEGGPRHISQALGLPSVAVFSPSARREQWLPNASEKYRGIEWQDVIPPKNTEGSDAFEYGDSAYFRRYNSIKPIDVIPAIDEVVAQFLSVRMNSSDVSARNSYSTCYRQIANHH